MPIKINFRSGKAQPVLSEGDIKTCKDGVFERRQSRFNGMHMVSNGRPVWEWKRVSDAPEGFKGRMRIEYKSEGKRMEDRS